MVHKRKLPEQRNPLILPEHTPQLEILVERRRLGQTNLHVKPGQVGLANASKSENLGLFDYAHLRVPLPKDLKGSGIFTLQKNQAYPESYFLMRRSSDGHISATGMFKAAYPWASIEEEEAERNYHKTMPTAGDEEVAGNVWISPEEALSLSDEYGMKPWIVALLDPEPIEKGTKDKGTHEIATPPKFVVPDKEALFPPTPVGSMRTRSRELRSASPSKTPNRKIASPRKPRATRRSARGASAEVATSSLQNSQTAEDTASAKANGLEPIKDESTHIEVKEVVEKDGNVETTTTTATVEVPPNHPEMSLPRENDAAKMIEDAKRMVEAANEAEGRVDGAKSKRKADQVEEDEGELAIQPAKKSKVLEQELKKEKVKRKALTGLGATLAIGYVLLHYRLHIHGMY
ncbi:hypothetical protein K490DRAFT_50436 [Saccharata proteae CBS 121410]|uniref:HTH APSES-type domain-containing protein n=1 Tax=Saccharata proteae CBS 121410 TaxID=1314787 RepID=A0A9P4HP84_9PEZI|nr:hypothetical protein K490DRAFT_50436 [Saccharata proteae CBS 121410]